MSNDDVSSISSYETTLELQDDGSDVDTPVQSFATPTLTLLPAPSAVAPTPQAVLTHSPQLMSPPVPPKSPEIAPNPGGSDVSKSTDSSNSARPRRKSVRMSLPPTFSATPPAVEDTDDTAVDERGGRGRHEPWSSRRTPNGDAHQPHRGGWGSRIKERDAWQDSSDDEDEEYSRAKRMLGRLSSSSKKHGK